MLYAVGAFIAAPCIYLRIDGKCHVVVGELDVERVRKKVRHCQVISYAHCVDKLRRNRIKNPSLAAVISALLGEYNLRKINVPPSFPIGLARELRHHDIKVRPRSEGVFPERGIKRAEEIKKISASLMMAEVGLAEGIQALKHSKIGKDGNLIYHGVPLTADKLRGIIDTAILQSGGWSNQTSVACGRQASNPRERGHGVLKAHQPIVLHVAPRSQKTGYYGDITRTVVKGRASEGVRRAYNTVLRAQEIAFGQMVANTSAREIHKTVGNFFEKEGYKTSSRRGMTEGFFNDTGHGLGMEVSEAPLLHLKSKDVLQAGHVVALEPGLYYHETGGARLEDIASVTSNGPRNLTKFDKTLEI